MKIAVTAASGGLGAAISKALIAHVGKSNVVGIARSPEKAKGLGIGIRQGDYNNKTQLIEALQRVEVVLLVSGMDAPEKRVQQHRNVIEAAKEAGVRKVVYTSIFGKPGGSMFDAIINSNRQTEEDLKSSGLEWSIGRNGLYLEPDLEYIPHYVKAGKIWNCAGNGKCGYTTREDLAYAYAQMILDDGKNGKTFTLTGENITQHQLTQSINKVFGTNLVYEPLSIEAYKKDRVGELGGFLGAIVASIYEHIGNGVFEVKSNYLEAAGKEHTGFIEYMEKWKQKDAGS